MRSAIWDPRCRARDPGCARMMLGRLSRSVWRAGPRKLIAFPSASQSGAPRAACEPREDRPARLAAVPGHDELRPAREPAVGARRGATRNRSCAERSRAAITFFDTADVYNGGAERGDHRPAPPQALHPRGIRSRDQGASGRRCRARTAEALAASTSWRRSTRRSPGSSSTTSTSTRSTAGTTDAVEETMEALHDVVKSGKARFIGASSMFAWQFAKAQARPRRTAGRGSSRCRTTTTSCIARRSGR